MANINIYINDRFFTTTDKANYYLIADNKFTIVEDDISWEYLGDGTLQGFAYSAIAITPESKLGLNDNYQLSAIANYNNLYLYSVAIGETYIPNPSFIDEAQLDEKFEEKQDVLTFDSTPTPLSANPVTSAGVYNALLNKADVDIVEIDTTAEWNKKTTYIPKKGAIIIYSDYKTETKNNTTIYLPGIKVGDGLAYVIDLPFMTEKQEADLYAHLEDTGLHIQSGERAFWNNKLNLVVNETTGTLIFNRN